MLSFSTLSDQLPAGSLEFVGNNQVKLNFSQLTGDTLTLDSSILKGLAIFMDGLSKYNHQLNENRKQQGLPAIDLCSKSFAGTPDEPIIVYAFSVLVNPNSFLNNLVDPTA